MAEHTHRIVGKQYIRSAGHSEVEDDPDTNAPYVVYAVGDAITPTDSELAANGDRFEAIAGDDADDSADAEDSDDAEDDAEDLSPADLEDMSYDELRSLAADYDDINGNWGRDRLQTELQTVIGE